MSDPTAANVIPIIPEPSEPTESRAPNLKHYRDRSTNLPLCGAAREEGNIAKAWKGVTCSACEAAKGKPGRPAKTADGAPSEERKVQPKAAAEPDEPLSVQVSILANAFLVVPACLKMRKGPPPADMVMQLGPAVVDVLDFYGYREQVDHPGVKLAVVASALALAVYSSPTIKDDKELFKAHGIQKTDGPT